MLKDVFRSGGFERESEGTFYGFGTETHPPSIDWILASIHFDIKNAGTNRYHEDNLYPSDHYPVQGVLDWKISAT